MGADEEEEEGSSSDEDNRGGDIADRLRRHRLESQGKFVRSIADSFSTFDGSSLEKTAHSGHTVSTRSVAEKEYDHM